MSIDPRQVEAVFQAAVACDDSVERAIVLERRCADDTELRKRVLALLRADADANELPRPRVAEADAGGDRLTEYAPGQVIAGRYRLVEEIAHGGMGTVWLAEQVEPVRRQVALKLIKPDMDSRRVLSRFEVERQALALMDHAGIAKVFDGGLTPAGRPFFAMEHVRGLPITEFCDRARMPVAERLRLFVQVCQAVHHAHQRGIIHRDLKPSNILVSPDAERAVSKVIDFGLAKAVHEPLAEDSLPTAQNVVMGTPRYMSPEQAELDNLDIDTRTDVYSLGVILYEMLTGDTPLSSERFPAATLPEILRRVREDELNLPSSRLTASAAAAEIARCRSAEPAQLRRSLRGDLDAIVMKALAKERSQRYESASDLARDVDRWLRHEPISARPPSAFYRFRKLARRHRLALAAAALVTTTLCGATIVSSLLAVRATQAGRVAEAARAAEADQRHIAQQERNEAERRRAQAEVSFRQSREAIRDHFFSMLSSKHLNVPELQPLRQKLLDSALAYYRKYIDQHGEDPALEAELAFAYFNCGELHGVVGSRDQALESLQEATRRYERLLERQATSSAGLYSEAALAYRHLGAVQQSMGWMQGAEASFRRALAIHEMLAQRSGENGDGWMNVASASARLAALRTTAGWHAEAEAPFLRAIELFGRLLSREATSKEYRLGLADAYGRFSQLLLAIGRLDDADATVHKSTLLCEQLVQDDPANWYFRDHLARAYYRLGHVQRAAGRTSAAGATFGRALDVFEDLARGDPSQSRFRRSIGDAHVQIGLVQSAAGQQEEAVRSWLAALDDFRAAADLRYSSVGLHVSIAEVLAQLGRWKEAASALAASLGTGDYACKPRCQLAMLQWMAGDLEAYRATCRGLVSKHAGAATPLQSAGIAAVCLIDDRAVDDWNVVLSIARQAAAVDPANPGYQRLVGAALYRCGEGPAALETLAQSRSPDQSAECSASPESCAARANDLLGEAMLALVYRDLGDRGALSGRLAALRNAVSHLTSAPRQYCDHGEDWRISLAVQHAQRELARLQGSNEP